MTFVLRDISHADLAATRRQFVRLGLHTGALDDEMRRRIVEEPPPAPPSPLPPLHVIIVDHGYRAEEIDVDIDSDEDAP